MTPWCEPGYLDEIVDPNVGDMSEFEWDRAQVEANDPDSPQAWVKLDCNWTIDAAIEEAAEEVGGLFMALVPILLAQGGQRGPFAAARLSLAELARIVRSDIETVRAALDVGIRTGAFIRRREHGGGLVHLDVAIRAHWRPYLSPVIRANVLERDGRVCGICGEEIAEGDELHIDHIKPLARGGSNDFDNLQPAHGSCNRRKGARG